MPNWKFRNSRFYSLKFQLKSWCINMKFSYLSENWWEDFLNNIAIVFKVKFTVDMRYFTYFAKDLINQEQQFGLHRLD